MSETTLVNYQQILHDELALDDMFDDDLDAFNTNEAIENGNDVNGKKNDSSKKKKRNRKKKSNAVQQQNGNYTNGVNNKENETNGHDTMHNDVNMDQENIEIE